MEMITSSRKIKSKNGTMRYMGIFRCPHCESEKEYEKYRGRHNKSCGCVAGRLRWENRRKKESLNKYIVEGNICKMQLCSSKGVFTGEAIIDKKDLHLVDMYVWRLTTAGYVYCSRIKKLLHQHLTGFERTDHIDGNQLNHRKNNLRESTNTQNCRNCKISKNNTSGYKGVIFRKDTKKWQGQIMVNRKHKSLGSYKNKIDAAKAYNDAALKYFGEFARINIL